MNNRKILIVDDDETTTKLVEDILQSHNNSYLIKTYQSCYEAAGMIKEYLPDLLIVGYNNIDIQGDEVVKTLKKEPSLQHMKIIGMSGNCSPDEVEKWKQIGIDDFIKKPFEIDHLIEKAENLLTNT